MTSEKDVKRCQIKNVSSFLFISMEYSECSKNNPIISHVI